MIAGETEAILNRYSEDYDEFFGLFKKKNKKELTPEEEEKRREKRANFWSGVTSVIDDLASINTRVPEPQVSVKSETQNPEIGQMESNSNLQNEKQEEDEPKNSSSFSPLLIGGIVVVVVVAAYAYVRFKPSNNINAHPTS